MPAKGEGLRGTAKVGRIYMGLPYFAVVALRVELTSEPASVVFEVSGDGFRSQGHLESVPEHGYDDWKSGAARGAKYAMTAAKRSARVTVTEITGLSTETNPSIVGLAAALAVWDALDFDPRDMLTPIEAVALESWSDGAPVLPELP